MLNLRFITCSTVLLCSSLLFSTLQAKTVWRCGEGGKSYSDSPCPGGKAVDVADPRSASDVRSGQDSVQRAQALAERMRQQRLQDEQRNLAANAGAANVGPSKAMAAKTDRGEKADKDDAVKPRRLPKKEPKLQHRQPHQQPKEAAADAGTFRATAVLSRQIRD